MSIYERSDKINTQLKVRTNSIESVNSSQQSVLLTYPEAAALSVLPQSRRNVEPRIISNRSDTYVTIESAGSDQSLNLGQFCNGQRAFLRIITSCIEKGDD